MRFTQPIQAGLHMIVEDDQYKVAVSYKNETNEQISVQTGGGTLFTLQMVDGSGSTLWTPLGGSTMAVTRWEFEPGSRATRHYDVPNSTMAEEKAKELVEQFDNLDLDKPEYSSVDPSVEQIIRLKTGVPASNSYDRLTIRQYDVRTNPARTLDDELPNETMEGVNRSSIHS